VLMLMVTSLEVFLNKSRWIRVDAAQNVTKSQILAGDPDPEPSTPS
jgi:hypothetical protein